MGFLAVKGLTGKLEPFLWITLGVLVALVLHKNISEKMFTHAFIIGIAWGLFNGWFQSLFFSEYLSNNPAYMEMLTKQAAIRPRFFPLLTGPIIGIITGVVLFGLTLLFKSVSKVFV